MSHGDDHALRVDVALPERQGLTDSEAGGVQQHRDGAVPEGPHGVQETHDFRLAQDDGIAPRGSRIRDRWDHFGPTQGESEEEP